MTLGDDFEIPADTSCTMDGTRVQGSIKLKKRSSLFASNVTVDGNIQAQAASALEIVSSRVGGSIQFEKGGSVSVSSSAVEGSIQLVANRGELFVGNNAIDADLQAFENSGDPAITFSSNEIGGNLQCKENLPAPGGGGNIVDGNREVSSARGCDSARARLARALGAPAQPRGGAEGRGRASHRARCGTVERSDGPRDRARGELEREEQAESLKERLEREHGEMMEELRALIPGAEVQFGFLLAICFTSEFASLTPVQSWVYYGTLVCTGAALVLFLAPAAHHRLRFREGEKEAVVRKGNRDAIAGSLAIGIAFTGVIYLVTSLVFDTVPAIVAAALFLGLIVWRWWLPGLRRV